MKILQCILTATLLLSSRQLSAMEKPTPESIKLTIIRSLELLGNMHDTHTSTTEEKRAALAERRAAIEHWNAMQADLCLRYQGKVSTTKRADHNDDDDDDTEQVI